MFWQPKNKLVVKTSLIYLQSFFQDATYLGDPIPLRLASLLDQEDM